MLDFVLLILVLLDALRASHTESENEHDVASELILILSHPIFRVLCVIHCLGGPSDSELTLNPKFLNPTPYLPKP